MQRTDELTLSFDEKTHTYTDDQGTVYAGVTDTVSSYFKKFDADTAIATSRASKTRRYEDKTDDQVKAEWEEARTLGTKMHAGFEHLLKACITDSMIDQGQLICETETLIASETPPEGWPLTREDTTRLLPEFRQFLAFVNAVPFERYCHSEFRVFSPKRGIAGTFDMLTYDDDGNCTLYDWKRIIAISKCGYGKKGFGILAHMDDSKYGHYQVQLNLYKTLLEENYITTNGKTPCVKSMKLVSFHKGKSMFEILPVTPLSEVSHIFGKKCVLLDLNGVVGVKVGKGDGKVSLRHYDFTPREGIEEFIASLKEKYVVGLYSSCRLPNILTCLSSVSEDFYKEFAYILHQEYCVLAEDVFTKDLTQFYADTGRDSSSVVLVEHELEKVVTGTTVALVEEWSGGDSPPFSDVLAKIAAV